MSQKPEWTQALFSQALDTRKDSPPGQVYYDLHIHSCLSPCGDNDMTVNNILNMCLLKGLDLIALTDHNSCKNCPALLSAASEAPITVLPGMELTTSEEVHVVCLFPALPQAMAFDQYVHDHLPKIQNVPHIFGEQWILDSEDEPVGQEELLLLNASTISISHLPALMGEFEGICWPAHIDRSSYSLLSNLGGIPPECGFRGLEVAFPETFFAEGRHEELKRDYTILTNSDAHDLGKLSEREHWLPLSSPDFRGLAELLG